ETNRGRMLFAVSLFQIVSNFAQFLQLFVQATSAHERELPSARVYCIHFSCVASFVIGRYLLRGEPPELSAFDEADDEQHDAGADKEMEEGADDPAAEQNAKLWQQPPRHKRADDTENDVADKSEAAAFDDLACEPTRDRANNQPDYESFDCHCRVLSI